RGAAGLSGEAEARHRAGAERAPGAHESSAGGMTMKVDVRLDAACDGMLVLEDRRARAALARCSALTVFDRSVTNPAVAPRRRIFQHRGRNDSIATGQPVAPQHGTDLEMDTATPT